jgi:hypothetical protein
MWYRIIVLKGGRHDEMNQETEKLWLTRVASRKVGCCRRIIVGVYPTTIKASHPVLSILFSASSFLFALFPDRRLRSTLRSSHPTLQPRFFRCDRRPQQSLLDSLTPCCLSIHLWLHSHVQQFSAIRRRVRPLPPRAVVLACVACCGCAVCLRRGRQEG